jgi:hypothetical protein
LTARGLIDGPEASDRVTDAKAATMRDDGIAARERARIQIQLARMRLKIADAKAWPGLALPAAAGVRQSEGTGRDDRQGRAETAPGVIECSLTTKQELSSVLF